MPHQGDTAESAAGTGPRVGDLQPARHKGRAVEPGDHAQGDGAHLVAQLHDHLHRAGPGRGTLGGPHPLPVVVQELPVDLQLERAHRQGQGVGQQRMGRPPGTHVADHLAHRGPIEPHEPPLVQRLLAHRRIGHIAHRGTARALDDLHGDVRGTFLRRLQVGHDASPGPGAGIWDNHMPAPIGG